jgi:hypothetical protein
VGIDAPTFTVVSPVFVINPQPIPLVPAERTADAVILTAAAAQNAAPSSGRISKSLNVGADAFVCNFDFSEFVFK